MTIKILTCHYAYNYGAVLQAYALTKYLNDNGYNTTIINYRPWYYRGSTKTTNKIKLLIRKVIRIPDNIKSEKVFYSFLRNNVPMTQELKDFEELESLKNSADAYIAGSDQIWNQSLPNGVDPAFYFDFLAPDDFKMSYAASLGMDILTDIQGVFLVDKLKRFKHIAVREKSAKKILLSFGIDDVQIVLDPVYLLDIKEWKNMMKKPQYMPSGDYILIFAFNRQKEIFEYGKRVAKKYNCAIVSVNTFWEDIFQGMDHYYWNCKPEEFLYLIFHAKEIITNSFHGLSFSIIFNRPVVLFEKNDSGNSRMNDLMDILEFPQKYRNWGKKRDDIPEIPYSLINKMVELKKQESMDYLSHSLRDIRSKLK